MASNVQSAAVAVQHWKKFDLPRLQKELDETATELANRQDESEVSRKKLVELSREFKRSTEEEIRRAVAPLLKSFQLEVDNLSQRSKAAEGAFLSIYKKLVECQDPLPFLETCHAAQQKAVRAQDLEIENKQLRETLNEYNEEFKEVRNQDVTIKQLRDKLRDHEDKVEYSAKAKAHEIERELQKQFDEKERHLEETQVIITKKFEEAERRIGEVQSALECTQTELFDLKAKYDEDSHAKSDEMEIVLNDLERANQRAAVAEKEVVSLKEQLAAVKQSLQLADQIQKAPDMEQAMDVLARSSLEVELAAKEKEISQLVDDIQRLQSTITTLKETSSSQIAQLENMLSEKNRIIHRLEDKLERQKDYSEIKQELQILKSMEFPDGDRTTAALNPKSSPKPLEVILLEKNKSLQSENMALKVAKAEVSGKDASLPPLRQEDLATEERIAQILSEAQVAMTSPAKENKSPSGPNGTLCPLSERKLFSMSSDNAAEDSRSEAGGGGGDSDGGGGGDKRSALCHSQNSNSSGGVNSSSRRSRKYENDDIPQEMVARIYQEELTKLLGQHVEEGFRQRDGYERTQEEIRQALTIYHQELARLSQISPLANSDSFTRFAAAAAAASTFSHGALINGGYASLMASGGVGSGNPPSRGRSVSPNERHNVPLDATVQSRNRHHHHHHHEPSGRPGSGAAGGSVEDAMRHHGSAFSLVRPKVEPGTTSGSTPTSASPTTAVNSGAGVKGGNSYNPVSRSPTGTPGSILSVADAPDDLSASASPLQRMQSITNSLLSQTSLPVLPTPTSRPTKAVLPPITQHQFDQYNNLNTEDIVKRVKEQLSQYSISQRLFGESVLGLSQGSVSDLLARPKPWHMLTQKGREPFIRMKIFLEDDNAVHKLVASQYKIAPEKLMRTGGFAGVPTPIVSPYLMLTGSNNKLASRPPDSVMVPYNKAPMELAHAAVPPSSSSSSSSYGVPCEASQLASSPSPDPHHAVVAMAALNNSVLGGHCHPSAAAVAAAGILNHSRRSHQHVNRSPSYVQPSVYEMAALTTDLDTQTITCKIKETLMAHNIGQKIFGEAVLGLSQGSVSELLSKPKPWHMLSIKGREPFIRMQLWLSDAHNVEKLQAIKNERREANKRRRSDYSDGCHSVPDNNFTFNFTPPSYPAAKKPRVLFSEEQKEALRLAFSMDPYPSTATIEFLATELNLSVRTITNWFHNHRMRLKQHISAGGGEDIKMSSENLLCLTNSILPGVREGANFDPVQFRTLLRRRLTDLQAQKGARNFNNNNNNSNNSNNSSPGIPAYGYSLFRGSCSPGQVDDSGTLDLSMSSQNHRKSSGDGRYSVIKSELMTDDHSSDDMNEDSSFSQDPGNMSDASDRDSVDDISNPGLPGSPRGSATPRPPTSLADDKRPLNFSLSVLSGSGGLGSAVGGVSVGGGGGSSNRRKPAMPQWVNPGLELSPDSDVCSDDDLDDLDDDDDDDDDDDGHEIINGVCVRQTNDFDLRLHKEETVRVEPAPVTDQNARRRRSADSPGSEKRAAAAAAAAAATANLRQTLRAKSSSPPFASLPNGELSVTNPRDLTKKPNFGGQCASATNASSLFSRTSDERSPPHAPHRRMSSDNEDRSLNIQRLEKSVNDREDSWEDGDTDEEKDEVVKDPSVANRDTSGIARGMGQTEKTDPWDF